MSLEICDIFVDSITLVLSTPDIKNNIEQLLGSGCVDEIVAIVRDYITRSRGSNESDSESEVPVVIPKKTTKSKKPKAVVEPEEEVAPKKKSKKPKAAAPVIEPEEEVAPKKKSKKPKAVVEPEEEVAPKKKSKKPKVAPVEEITDEDLEKMTIVMLKTKCKELNIKPVGNKQVLINKIKEQLSSNIDVEVNVEEDPDEGPSYDPNEIKIVQDDDNLYIHKESGLIFDPNAKVVVAWKDQDGTVLPLTNEHIELCQQYGFEFRIDED